MPVGVRTKTTFTDRQAEALEEILVKQVRPAIKELAQRSAREFNASVPVGETGELARSGKAVAGKRNKNAWYLTANFYWRYLDAGTVHITARHFVDPIRRSIDEQMAEVFTGIKIG